MCTETKRSHDVRCCAIGRESIEVERDVLERGQVLLWEKRVSSIIVRTKNAHTLTGIGWDKSWQDSFYPFFSFSVDLATRMDLPSAKVIVY